MHTQWPQWRRCAWVMDCWPTSRMKQSLWSAWGIPGERLSGKEPGVTGEGDIYYPACICQCYYYSFVLFLFLLIFYLFLFLLSLFIFLLKLPGPDTAAINSFISPWWSSTPPKYIQSPPVDLKCGCKKFVVCFLMENKGCIQFGFREIQHWQVFMKAKK